MHAARIVVPLLAAIGYLVLVDVLLVGVSDRLLPTTSVDPHPLANQVLAVAAVYLPGVVWAAMSWLTRHRRTLEQVLFHVAALVVLAPLALVLAF
ncbi:hypothetical protein [Cellulomonas chitinilytica]|uniref:hypothetical protein n=1 Tax=Cellulomonas chitinilytica TaxID=398759 RepID=UPI0019441959|nr:hypothetical protein [Cellulomonas chitinilytica]